MKAAQQLHDLGQGLWLDNITRDLLNLGTLQRNIEELSVTGLTSNPAIFDHAISNSNQGRPRSWICGCAFAQLTGEGSLDVYSNQFGSTSS